ncbi:RsfA family transcriptional regulator [Virgibacillus soli]|uniref:RsfA family transcriptional regulator n=1 Tax=Paracerasibacillus soli TaxID=480284 RepID=A0ABU5CP09_9BACI|nr:RsfA family transcriptional regulator [Virgibacillus soli]MDY0408094.1 RsfA family transcriptional regulator [Virgibacillus soli]
MHVTRQDAWTEDEDIILAETVLRYIRQGKTQLEAFKHVARQLSRTSAACGFRWNATLRKKYQDAIQLAKEDRKQRGQFHWEVSDTQHEEENPIEAAISLLEKMKGNFAEQATAVDENKDKLLQHLKSENNQLKMRVARYESAWKEMHKLWSWVEEKNITQNK